MIAESLGTALPLTGIIPTSLAVIGSAEAETARAEKVNGQDLFHRGT